MTKFDIIVAKLKNEPFLDNFSFRKRDSSFIYKFDGGCMRIELEHWSKWGEVCIRPGFFLRFDFVHKWFEKFSFKDILVQRDNFVVWFQGESFGPKSIFSFSDNVKDYEREYIELLELLKKGSTYVFNKYRTPEDVYTNDILPIIKGEKCMPQGGIDWFFEYLTICKVVAPENYKQLKALLMEHAHWRMTHYSFPEPNMAMYYDRLNEILEYLESLSVDDLMCMKGVKREELKKIKDYYNLKRMDLKWPNNS